MIWKESTESREEEWKVGREKRTFGRDKERRRRKSKGGMCHLRPIELPASLTLSPEKDELGRVEKVFEIGALASSGRSGTF